MLGLSYLTSAAHSRASTATRAFAIPLASSHANIRSFILAIRIHSISLISEGKKNEALVELYKATVT